MHFKILIFALFVTGNAYAENCSLSVKNKLLTVCNDDGCEYHVLDLERGIEKSREGVVNILRNRILYTEIPVIYLNTELRYVIGSGQRVLAIDMVQQKYCNGQPCFEPLVWTCGSVQKYLH